MSVYADSSSYYTAYDGTMINEKRGIIAKVVEGSDHDLI